MKLLRIFGRKRNASRHQVLAPGIFRFDRSVSAGQVAQRIIPPEPVRAEQRATIYKANGQLLILGVLIIAYAWSACHFVLIADTSYATPHNRSMSYRRHVITESSKDYLLNGGTIENHDPIGVLKLTNKIMHAEYEKTQPDYQLPPIQNGMAPVLLSVPTTKSVVFLTIDDGAHKDLQDLSALQNSHNRASLFLADIFMRNDPTFFKQYVAAGFPVENHSRDHILKPHQSYDQQKQQICSEADAQEAQFGRRPQLFRPPGGFYNADTQRAAADCGMKAIVMWHAKAESGKMMYQDGDKLKPGDIVLMHFRPEFRQDLDAFVAAERAAGLHTELLEDWLILPNTD